MTPMIREALIVLVSSLVFAACAAEPAPMAPPQAAEAPPSLFGNAGKGTSPVDEQMLAIAKAEEEIDKLFPDAGKPPSYGRKKAPLGEVERNRAIKEEPRDPSAATLSTVDPCAVACRALDSMKASADHLCKLAGEGDGRCEDARGRVRGASGRVRSVCPACPSAAH